MCLWGQISMQQDAITQQIRNKGVDSETHTWEDAWRCRRSSPAPSFGCWDWEHCTEPEPSMPIGRQRRAGCWLPGLGSPHYSWGGVGSSHAGRQLHRGMSEWFLPNCFSKLCPFFHSNSPFSHSVWHFDLNDQCRHMEQWGICVFFRPGLV